MAAAACLAGALAITVIWVRSGPPLRVWHTEELTAEFSEKKAARVRSLADYLKLEDALFAQLETQVYAQTETGRANTLVRYSAGSAADPRRWKKNWNRSYELPVDTPKAGVLLLHGMSDSPYSLRALGAALNGRGLWVTGMRLPGHGTAPSGLVTVRWEDMAAAVQLAMVDLQSKVAGAPVHIVGYSTGASLAVSFALDSLDGVVSPRPASLVLISPAIGITRLAGLAHWKVRFAALPGLARMAWTDINPEFDPFKYNSFTSNAAVQVHRLTHTLTSRLAAQAGSGRIEGFPPTLVFASAADATVLVDAVVDDLLDRLAPAGHELVLFDINRNSVASTVLVSDPAPLPARLLRDEALPFALGLITNENDESAALVRRAKGALSRRVTIEPLELEWPGDVISLSHVALPFPPDDPLYGRGPPGDDTLVFLGQTGIRGERGLLRFSANWLLRLRHNPFYELLELRTLDWMAGQAISPDDKT